MHKSQSYHNKGEGRGREKIRKERRGQESRVEQNRGEREKKSPPCHL
jgi:hypothetical protein